MQTLLLRDHQDNSSLPFNIPSLLPFQKSDLSQIVYKRFNSLDFASQDSTDHERASAGISSSSKDIQKSVNGRKDKYCVISNKIRLELIDLVVNKKEKIKRAAVKLGINYSSAKSIFQVYRKEGRLDKKSSKKTKAKHQAVSDTLSESNLANSSDHIDFIPADKPLMLPDDVSKPTVSQAKVRDSSILSNDCLMDLNQLSIKLKRSEAQSECSTVNTLSYSRNTSGTSELGQYGCSNKANEETPTFFSRLMKKDPAPASELSSQKYTCPQGPVIREIPKPEYKVIPQQQILETLLLKQQQQQEGQINELVKELVKSKLLNHQLNQLRNFNNLLAIQNQGLY